MVRGLRLSAWTLLAGLVATVGPIGHVAAQDHREPPPEAVEFYRSGREHFEAGRYREAITDLERALTLDPGSATLVYNLARVHELLGELDVAIDYYARYLRLLPESETDERARIRETIGRLQGAQSHVGPPAHQGPPPDVAEEDEPRWVNERGVVDLPFWVAAGASAALFVAGGAVGFVALDRESLAQDFVLGSDGTLAERDDIANQADSLAVTADVLLLGGAAAAITAALLYALRTRTVERFPEHPQQAEPFVATDGSAAVVGVRGSL